MDVQSVARPDEAESESRSVLRERFCILADQLSQVHASFEADPAFTEVMEPLVPLTFQQKKT